MVLDVQWQVCMCQGVQKTKTNVGKLNLLASMCTQDFANSGAHLLAVCESVTDDACIACASMFIILSLYFVVAWVRRAYIRHGVHAKYHAFSSCVHSTVSIRNI